MAAAGGVTPSGPAARGPRVLGIDPGLAATGWAVLEPAGARPLLIACGTLRTLAADERAARLVLLARGLRDAIAAHRPAVAAVEEALVARNARSALALGEARGVALATAAAAGLAVYEYLPMHIKQAVTGYGHAEKAQVERMVSHLLGNGEPPGSSHAADAIAVALCHLGHGGIPRAAARARGSARAAWTAFAAGRAR
ncbi:MAG TPA: crossover junction endodeoxyribonuclease RuvC [Candidatus Methanoperedens sp.]|nr:crossover junction endodeoxyribonuclease RuvC [Candidatus Methanoperedens sp.]